jgi:hypothetical protein
MNIARLRGLLDPRTHFKISAGVCAYGKIDAGFEMKS